MSYTKEDAKMTQGLAIVCMVVLHLFCRQGTDVLGTPLLWFDDTTPIVFWFGFFGEICVPLYALCMGYAQELLFEKNKSDFCSRIKRIGALMMNYWIVLVFFSIAGLIIDPNGSVPGSIWDFLKATILLKSYNGAWWFLHTYVFLLLLPPKWLLFPAQKLKPWICVSLCLGLYTAMYVFERFEWFDISQTYPAVAYVGTEVINALGVLPYVWLGALFCKWSFIEHVTAWWNSRVLSRLRKPLLAMIAVALFVGTNLLHKAIIMGPIAVISFVLFNLWQKSRVTKKVMLFLGEHSTNVWLVHMFFYAYVFVGLVECARYPLFMLLFMFGLCIATSYIIKLFIWMCNRFVGVFERKMKVC